MKKGDILTSNYGGVETKVKLMSNVDRLGRAAVRVLKVGLLDEDRVQINSYIKGFNVTHGVIKFNV